MAQNKFIDKEKLNYFWRKVKSYLSTNYAAKSHTHAESEITGLTDDLSAINSSIATKADKSNPVLTGTVMIQNETDATKSITITADANQSATDSDGNAITPAAQGRIGGIYIPLVEGSSDHYYVTSDSATAQFNAADRTKLDDIEAGANKTTVDSEFDITSTNPVQNKVVKDALDGKSDTGHTHAIADVTNLQTTINNINDNLDSKANASDLELYARIDSPTFTGTPAAPTATAGTSTTQLATTEFVTTALTNFAGGTSLAAKVDVESGTANNLTVENSLTLTKTDSDGVTTTFNITPAASGDTSVTNGDGGSLIIPYVSTGTTETVALLSDLPTKTSELTNDSGYLTEHQDISGKVNKAGDTMTGTLTMSGSSIVFDNGNTDDNKQMSIQAAAAMQSVAIGTIGGISVPVNGTGKFFALESETGALQSNIDAKADTTTVNSALALKADLASPALTGVPTAPTASTGTNTTQVATTAFVQAAVTAAIGGVSQMGFAVVTSLPDTGDPTKIYLVAHTHTESGSTDAQGKSDSYDEYVWLTTTSAYEKIGNTDIDIQVITNAEIDAIVV